MANSLSFPQYYSKEYQLVFHKQNVARAIADTAAERDLANGDTFHKPYKSVRVPQQYVRGTDIVISDITDTDETLVVNKASADGFYLDNFDKIQNNKDAATSYGRDSAIKLNNLIDADVFNEVLNGTTVVDDGILQAGVANNKGINLSASNSMNVLSEIKKRMDRLNIPQDGRFGVISPDLEQRLLDFGYGRDTQTGEDAYKNGYLTNVYGMELYTSNLLLNTLVLQIATNPTANDTITIPTWASQDGTLNSQIFTFVSSIGTTAGNILIGANAAATRANLVTLFNAPGTTTSTGVALTGNNLNHFLSFISAVDYNSTIANTVLIKYKGAGTLSSTVVTSSLTATADGFAQIRQHCVFGQKGCISLVVQSEPTVKLVNPPAKMGMNVLVNTLYGVKTFTDGKPRLVNVILNALTY